MKIGDHYDIARVTETDWRNQTATGAPRHQPDNKQWPTRLGYPSPSSRALAIAWARRSTFNLEKICFR